MIPDAIEVRLKPKVRAELEARLPAATTQQRQLLRIRIVLEAGEGWSTREIARELDTTPTTVSLWRGRFAREGLPGLEDLPRSGAPPIYGEATGSTFSTASTRSRSLHRKRSALLAPAQRV
jgi:transposase